MTPFLKRIADAYFERHSDSLADFCFVFPNKRSATFFRHFLSMHADSGKPFIEPEVTTISDFIAEFSDYVAASRYDLLFTLYNLYNSMSSQTEEFDKFVFWGDMLLGDFNDVDRYMTDAGQLFRNLKNYKEINADYLTPQQKEIINKYWGAQIPLDDIDRFWTHIDNPRDPHTNRESFMRLWEILEPLYGAFRDELSSRGLCYPGMQYREVAEKLSMMQPGDMPYRRIIMAGFNVLSISELCIFSRLHELGIADFYWDYAFPDELRADNMATHFISRYVKLFPSRYDIDYDGEIPIPEIDVVGIPSNVGQVKYAGRLIDRMVKDGSIADRTNAIDTAIVLPSEDLFIELLHSIPASIPSVNITMGYPMKLTPAAALMRSIMTMHLKARKIRGNWCFFYEDVCDVLANPLLARINPDLCEAIRNEIRERRLFSVPADYLRATWEQFEKVFYPVTDLHSGTEVFSYTLQLVEFLERKLKATQSTENDTPAEVNEATDIPDDMLPPESVEAPAPVALELGFLSRYRQSVEQLRDVADRYGITMRDATFFHLIRSVVDAETVNFTGEPLKGLQIMGILETRALNFDNLIILSMNERIFPKRHFSRSFIPNILRRCFGMATMEFQECIFAYYFYRMISAARNVTLIYDTRTEALNSGDMSRYIYQLLHHYPQERIRMHKAAFNLPAPGQIPDISIAKDEQLMRIIDSYRASEGRRRYLSPSAINTYISCPLKFCLHYLRGLKDDTEVTDYMDESTFGKVLHQVAEYSYNHLRGNRKEITVTAEMLDGMVADDIAIEKLITSAINLHFNRLPNLNTANPEEEYINLAPLYGEARVIADIMLIQMKHLFRLEKQRAPFVFIEAERRFETSVPLSPTLSINLVGVIDRIDRRDDRMEIIDYKTGSDEIKVVNLSHLFEPPGNGKGHHKAILQLFLYCNALRMETGYNGAIRPLLFRFRKLSAENSIPEVVIDKEPLSDYRDLNDKVKQELAARLASLFDATTPFTPSPHPSHCRFCNYKSICGQNF
ncbi:PD-(D/E)XK nuclease family protein [uncultured Muribaculum sp.]|uniref:PD-(D/E)XK nuclease family protein n=1 Tax=uncultured Muribaculum sp. TaxID=1918613 RepID=UPI0025F69088|nr:PD-(D/E)XK nuclease family protein [uncultured Muribaculum sp.]